jgi:TonB family protein
MPKKKVLLIDFDAEFVKFLSRSLVDEGYDVITAPDGLAGFEKFSEIQPDLVIMEAMLPKFHGFELCSRITSHPTKKSPVIIVTGIYKDAVYKTEALRNLGASAFFEKPINLEQLLNKVYELIGKDESKRVVSHSEEDLDKLLKEALTMTTSDKKPTEKIKPVEKTPRKEEPARTASRNRDDEVDLILESRLKDIISETTKTEKRPASTSAGKTEKERITTRSSVEKKTITGPSAGTSESLKKPSSPVEPVVQKKAEPVKAEPKLEPKIESTPAPVHQEEKSRSASVLTRSPFKGFIEEKEESESRKKSSGKFIGMAAGALVIIAVVAVLIMKKKETPTFSGQPSNQVAALQTVESSDQPKAQPYEQDLNKEIETQIAAYRNQRAQAASNSNAAETKNTKALGPSGKTNNKVESTAAPLPPILPEESPRLAANLNSVQSEGQASKGESGTTTTEKSASEVRAAQPSENKSEGQPTIYQAQKAKTGDLVPLTMVEVEPKIIKTVDPVYPEADKRFGIKGNIILNVLISENGSVLDVAVIRGVKGSVALEREAINAVKRWKFLPAEKDGVKVRVWKPITIGFGTK